ncbi:MAG: VanZ family protein [Bacteroidota bacterium]
MYKLISFTRTYAKYLLIAWIAVIIIVSSSPSIPSLKIHTEKTDIRLDYLIHFLEYASLAFLTYLAFAGKDFRMPALRYLILTLCLIIFAIADESHQILIPGRTFNPKDLLSNVAGIAGGLVFCVVVFRKICKGIPG